MRSKSSVVLGALALVVSVLLAGCAAGGGGSASGRAASVFAFDTAKTVDVHVGAKGAGTVLDTGNGKAAIWVRGGAAPEATWKVTPIAKAPEGAKGILVPGVYVDTAGAEPSGTCSVGFLLPGSLPKGATVVKYAEDGSSWTPVPSVIVTVSASQIVVAEVDGFSAYGLGDGGDGASGGGTAAGGDAASGKQVDWTIKVIGGETQKAQGWQFQYDLDFFASGGGVGQGGTYRGHGQVVMVGKYDETLGGIIKGLGDIKATARDDNLSFTICDAPLADLLTGQDVNSEDGVLRGSGIFHGKTQGKITISATGPNVSGKVDKTANGDSPVPFTVEIAGADVKVEIENMGIFGGKILRTEK
jgi:hypothetical protein